MIALIKADNPNDIICEPFPEWLNPIAFCIYDCYGYAFCNNYEPAAEGESRSFTFGQQTVDNPFKQSEDDPDTVIVRTAVMNE